MSETLLERERAVSQRTARAVAVEALSRVDEGAYANLVLPGLLERSGLADRDRHLVTELVYGTTRMRRACDFVLQPFLQRDLEPEVRTALRLGAYQLVFLGTPAHAAVSTTVDVAPARARGLVNAVLRRVSEAKPPRWPNLATELSYPDWVVDRLVADLGEDAATGALRRMNVPAAPNRRTDGYVQDRASQWVAELVDAGEGDVVVDVCAAPGGKATWMARTARRVIAGDARASRTGLIAANARRTQVANVSVLAMDAPAAPLRRGRTERVYWSTHPAPGSACWDVAPTPAGAWSQRASSASPGSSARSSTTPCGWWRRADTSSTACAPSPTSRRSTSTPGWRRRIPRSSRSIRRANRGRRMAAALFCCRRRPTPTGCICASLRRS